MYKTKIYNSYYKFIISNYSIFIVNIIWWSQFFVFLALIFIFSLFVVECSNMADRIKDMRAVLRKEVESLDGRNDWKHVTDQIGIRIFFFLSISLTYAHNFYFALWQTRSCFLLCMLFIHTRPYLFFYPLFHSHTFVYTHTFTN